MTKTLPHLGIVLTLAGSALLAQNCPERNLGTALGSGDDVMFGMQSIGFTFPFAGATYTDVHVCTNGFLNLSNAGVPAPDTADYTATAAELGNEGPRICPMWTDIFMPAATGGICYINSTATKCTITWDQATNYGSPAEFQMQVQLFPSGEIKFFYSAGTINASTFSLAAAQAIVGVSPGGGVTLPLAANLSTAGATADNTLFEGFAGGGFDMPASSLSLTATSPGWVHLPAALANCAATSNYGEGCIQANDSYYELLTPATFDMANRSITMLRQGNGYFVLDSIPAVIVPPSPSAVQVAIGDDTVQTVALSAPLPIAGGSTTSMTICSNARISLSAGGPAALPALPTVTNFLAFADTIIACNHDYDQSAAGSGQILFEEVGGVVYVTWDNVISWSTTSADTLQFQFNLSTGDITLVFGACNPAGGGYLIGYSVGGPSPDPGPVDVSSSFATGALVTDVPVGPGLALTGAGLPVIGSSSYTFVLSNVPNVVPLALLFFGDAATPGIDLAFLGAPACRAYTNANLVSLTIPVALPAGTGSQALAVPPNPTLAGITFTCQGAAFTLANPLGLVTSNGTAFTVGF